MKKYKFLILFIVIILILCISILYIKKYNAPYSENLIVTTSITNLTDCEINNFDVNLRHNSKEHDNLSLVNIDKIPKDKKTITKKLTLNKNGVFDIILLYNNNYKSIYYNPIDDISNIRINITIENTDPFTFSCYIDDGIYENIIKKETL